MSFTEIALVALALYVGKYMLKDALRARKP